MVITYFLLAVTERYLKNTFYKNTPEMQMGTLYWLKKKTCRSLNRHRPNCQALASGLV